MTNGVLTTVAVPGVGRINGWQACLTIFGLASLSHTFTPKELGYMDIQKTGTGVPLLRYVALLLGFIMNTSKL